MLYFSEEEISNFLFIISANLASDIYLSLVSRAMPRWDEQNDGRSIDINRDILTLLDLNIKKEKKREKSVYWSSKASPIHT